MAAQGRRYSKEEAKRNLSRDNLRQYKQQEQERLLGQQSVLANHVPAAGTICLPNNYYTDEVR